MNSSTLLSEKKPSKNTLFERNTIKNLSSYIFTTSRILQKRKKNLNLKYRVTNSLRTNDSINKTEKETMNSNNDESSFNNSKHLKYKSQNISSYIQLNTTNNTSNFYNESISTNPLNLKNNYYSNIDLEGKKFLNKQNYGKLLLFNENIREERYQTYFNKILTNEFYFRKQNKLIKPKQIEIKMYNYKINEKYLDTYINTLKNYTKKFILYTDKEKDINEKLILKKTNLKLEVNRLNQRLKKLLDIFLYYLSIKKFLLHVKNKSLSFCNFTYEDIKEYLRDEDKKELVLNFYKKDDVIKRNSVITKKSSFPFSHKNSPRRSQIINSPKKKVSKRESDKNLIKNLEDEPLNKPIFDSVDSFFTIYDILNNENTKLLIDYNDLIKENKKNRMLLSNLKIDYEKFQKERENKLNDEIKHILKEKEILKNRNEELIKERNYLIKISNESEKKKEMNKLIQNKIYIIYHYINKNYKKYIIQEDFLNKKNINLERLKFIEDIINKLSIEKEIFINKFPNEYHNYRITKNLKEKLRQFENKKKEDIEKAKKLMEKVYEHNNKIIILPKHKVIEKFNFQKTK